MCLKLAVRDSPLYLVVATCIAPTSCTNTPTGPNTFEQSCAAASIDSTIAIIGTRAGQAPGTVLPHTALVQTRRIMIGSRLQFEEMSRAIEVNDIKPVVDGKVFGFGEVREAYEYLWEQKAVGKVVVDVE